MAIAQGIRMLNQDIFGFTVDFRAPSISRFVRNGWDTYKIPACTIPENALSREGCEIPPRRGVWNLPKTLKAILKEIILRLLLICMCSRGAPASPKPLACNEQVEAEGS
jgi:hypothetical protein